MEALQQLLTDQLRDIYDAEKQLTKSLPKMAKAAANQELRTAFSEHVEVTKNQVARLEEAFGVLGEKAKSKPCKGMKGLVEEGQEHMGEHEKGSERDHAMIGSALRVEHYEMAAYTAARSTAKAIGNREVVALLQETLKEEEQTGKLLLQIGERLQKEMLQSAAEEESGEEEETQPRGQGGSRRGGAKKAAKRGSSGSAAKSGGRSSAQANGRASSSRGGGNARGGGGARGGNARGGNGSSGASSVTTTDHEEIRRWAEERGAKPSCVMGTGRKGDTGMIRLDFPGYSGGGSLQEISWEDWFEKFDKQGLALLHQEQTAAGEQSNFNKLVSRETAAASGRKGGGKKSASKSRR